MSRTKLETWKNWESYPTETSNRVYENKLRLFIVAFIEINSFTNGKRNLV